MSQGHVQVNSVRHRKVTASNRRLSQNSGDGRTRSASAHKRAAPAAAPGAQPRAKRRRSKKASHTPEAQLDATRREWHAAQDALREEEGRVAEEERQA